MNYLLATVYLGVPYKHGGRDITTGLDCYGLILKIYENLGINLFDIDEDYDENWSFKGKNYFLENIHNDWVEVTTPRLFDIVLFKNCNGVINHAGVMLSEKQFIHTCRAGTIISNLDSDLWKDRFVGFYRHKKLI